MVVDHIHATFHWMANALTVRHPILGAVVAVLGVAKLVYVLNSYFSVIIDTMIPRGPQLAPYKRSMDRSAANWAIVTGCTAGIGEEFAKQLARAGLNLLLVSRSRSKLDALAAEIETKFNVKTEAIAIDAATAGAAEYARLREVVSSLGAVSVLINNVGVSHDIPTPFTEVSDEEMQKIIQVNCVATLETTRAVLPALLRQAKQARGHRSLILTMGSFAGLTPTPLLSVYSGSKAFLQGWSSALAAEVENERVDVQVVLSYLVTSQMSKVRRTSLMVTNPKSFVNSCLRQIGSRGGAQERAYTLTPFWSHAFLHWLLDQTFGVFSFIVAKFNLKMHEDVRRRALKKRAKKN